MLRQVASFVFVSALVNVSFGYSLNRANKAGLTISRLLCFSGFNIVNNLFLFDQDVRSTWILVLLIFLHI